MKARVTEVTYVSDAQAEPLARQHKFACYSFEMGAFSPGIMIRKTNLRLRAPMRAACGE